MRKSRHAVDAVIAETGAASIKDMGKVMKACMARFAGRPVDGGKVSELVKAKLTELTNDELTN